MESNGKEVYSRVLWQDEPGYNQVRLVVNIFREKEYIHIRRYYLDFDEVWMPSGDGVCMNLEIESTRELFEGMAEIISLAESREVIEEYFGDIIKKIYK